MRIKNNRKLVTAPNKTALLTTIKWVMLPARRFPNGIRPAKAIIKILITLPLTLSGTLSCNKVFIIAIAVMLVKPRITR